MKQQILAKAANQCDSFKRYRRPTPRDEFLATMNGIVPWAELCAVIEPHYRGAATAPHPPTPTSLARVLRMYIVPHWLILADDASEEAPLESVVLRRFVGIDLGGERVPDGPRCSTATCGKHASDSNATPTTIWWRATRSAVICSG